MHKIEMFQHQYKTKHSVLGTQRILCIYNICGIPLSVVDY
uniref:Uncharacterized protein n=1 Tax=Anguilla anguilla TaxID=7936 RepID=A0A0E9RK48_ANGAN